MLKGLVVGLALVSICAVFHIIGLLLIANSLVRRWWRLEREFSITNNSLILAGVFSLIILLHLAETAIWAVYYDLWGLFNDLETSVYFSLKTYSTIGYGDVLLPEGWRLLGGLEGIAGILLCGLSAAFLFAIVSEMFKAPIERKNRR